MQNEDSITFNIEYFVIIIKFSLFKFITMKKLSFFLMFSIAIFAGCKNDGKNSLVTSADASSLSNSNAPASTVSNATPPQISASVTKVDPSSNQIQSSNTLAATHANEKTTTVKFEELSYDWGTLEEGKQMTHLFKFKNTGKEDLIISDARGSCGCTVPEWPKEPIKPGQNSEIKVVFNSAGKGGQVNKTVTITANSDPSPITLVIKGTVEPVKGK